MSGASRAVAKQNAARRCRPYTQEVISLTQIGATALACVVLIALPGPSVMFVVGRALTFGRTNAVLSVLGNAIGCYLAGVAVALGLGPLLERSEFLFQTIKWAGIAYLIWLGVQALRKAGSVTDTAPATTGSKSRWEAIRTGIIVGLTNPKSFVLFTAVVPQFINPAAGNTTLQILLLGLIPLFIGLVTDTTWALLASRARAWLARSPRRMTIAARGGGISILGVGVSLALSDTRP